MNPNPASDQSGQVESLFSEAVELGEGRRAEFLDRACKDRPALRSEIESLLTAFDVDAGSVRGLFEELPLARQPTKSTGSPDQQNDDSVLGLGGQRVGHYQILHRLGGGGMGVVYHAYDERLGRSVALKFLPLHLSKKERAKERLMQEARSTSALDHPNICTVHDIGETDDGLLFIVMTFYQGRTLKYRLADGPMAPDQAVGILKQVAEALGAAHEAGIVHRDIKPANVMITDKGRAKILDFGIAKLTWGMDLTETGRTLGTVHYMSPEQIKGADLDQRADLWSLGVLFYQMLTGTLPFDGSHDLAVMFSIMKQETPELPAEIPGKLSGLIARLLQKEPNRRYQTTAELLADLLKDESAIAPARSADLNKGSSTSRLVYLTIAAILVIFAIALLLLS